MALGHCAHCGELVQIVPGKRHDAEHSSHRWYPVAHKVTRRVPDASGENEVLVSDWCSGPIKPI